MKYKVEISTWANRQILSWNLPDYLLIEIHLRLQNELAKEPETYLRRWRTPFDAMGYDFSIVDPKNRFVEHAFVFVVVFSQDEERLIVQEGMHIRHSGI